MSMNKTDGQAVRDTQNDDCSNWLGIGILALVGGLAFAGAIWLISSVAKEGTGQKMKSAGWAPPHWKFLRMQRMELDGTTFYYPLYKHVA